MAYSESRARELVVEAGHRLISSGLTARTWGNISARVSDSQFIITPSGRDYVSLSPGELVMVNIKDCTFEGGIRPSGESGIHAAGYRLRPEVELIIHTHQFYASAVSADGGLARSGGIPCAAYGMPSSGRLCFAVERALRNAPDDNAFLMSRHGALCLSNDFEDAFSAAETLESRCRALYLSRVGETGAAAISLGNSSRQGDSFVFEENGKNTVYPIQWGNDELPWQARLHAAIYSASETRCIRHCLDSEVTEVSRQGRTLYPVLDDLAQIAGVSVRCVPAIPERVSAVIRGRDAVLIRGFGGLCLGTDQSEAEAVAYVLKKDCAAALLTGSLRGLPFRDALKQRRQYVNNYSRLRYGK